MAAEFRPPAPIPPSDGGNSPERPSATPQGIPAVDPRGLGATPNPSDATPLAPPDLSRRAIPTSKPRRVINEEVSSSTEPAEPQLTGNRLVLNHYVTDMADAGKDLRMLSPQQHALLRDLLDPTLPIEDVATQAHLTPDRIKGITTAITERLRGELAPVYAQRAQERLARGESVSLTDLDLPDVRKTLAAIRDEATTTNLDNSYDRLARIAEIIEPFETDVTKKALIGLERTPEQDQRARLDTVTLYSDVVVNALNDFVKLFPERPELKNEFTDVVLNGLQARLPDIIARADVGKSASHDYSVDTIVDRVSRQIIASHILGKSISERSALHLHQVIATDINLQAAAEQLRSEGKPVTHDVLVELTGVSQKTAKDYVREHFGSDREQRQAAADRQIEAAIAQLRREGKPITQAAIINLTNLRTRAVSNYAHEHLGPKRGPFRTHEQLLAIIAQAEELRGESDLSLAQIAAEIGVRPKYLRNLLWRLGRENNEA